MGTSRRIHRQADINSRVEITRHFAGLDGVALHYLGAGQAGIVSDCGHWIAEEQPEFLVEQLLAFFGKFPVR